MRRQRAAGIKMCWWSIFVVVFFILFLLFKFSFAVFHSTDDVVQCTRRGFIVIGTSQQQHVEQHLSTHAAAAAAVVRCFISTKLNVLLWCL